MSNDHVLREGLLAAMRHSIEPMVLSDPRLPDNPIVAVNEGFLALTGYAEAEVVGRNCRFLQGPGTDRLTVERMGASLRSGSGCVQWLMNHRKDGSVFWNLLFISPVFDRDGTLVYFFANQHDLSGQAAPDLAEFPLGAAHMPAPQRAEFQAIVEGLGQAADDARTLEATVADARRLARLSMQLAAGA